MHLIAANTVKNAAQAIPQPALVWYLGLILSQAGQAPACHRTATLVIYDFINRSINS